MPVFQETSTAGRDFRYLPSLNIPLPRFSKQPQIQEGHHEVVVVGAGPSGLFLTFLLARYGISGKSLLCLDQKPGSLRGGQADGLQPRTLEVFKSLGISDEILHDGCQMAEVAFWNSTTPDAQQPKDPNDKTNGEVSGTIERSAFHPDVNVPARFPYEITIHQGRIERIIEEELNLYTPSGTIERSTRFIGFEDDPEGSPEHPIVVHYERESAGGVMTPVTVRTKYLVGADGAHSRVREQMGFSLKGETTDHIWGVCDFVVDTDFPDIRKRCAVHAAAGSVMVIPRERIATGEYLTRLYVQVPVEVTSELGHDAPGHNDAKQASKKRREAVTLDYIFSQARAVFAPYHIGIKEGTEPDWYAAYQIGQRMTPRFSKSTRDGVERLFIVGDACHTHSPKAGQGMNVSMMDSYNLSWKLAHSILGLTPQGSTADDAVLSTFSSERADIARQLIDFDTNFSSMFSGKMAPGTSSSEGLTHASFLELFNKASGFTSGCGIQYAPNVLVESNAMVMAGAFHPNESTLTLGKRLPDALVRRYADATLRHLHDEIGSTGRYSLLVFASNDLLNAQGVSQKALMECDAILLQYPDSMINLLVMHPILGRFEWTDIPMHVKSRAEMRFYGIQGAQDVYKTYGVPHEEGAVVALRPDGYVGGIWPLSAAESVDTYFSRCLARVAIRGQCLI